jgi:hypothetical protein
MVFSKPRGILTVVVAMVILAGVVVGPTSPAAAAPSHNAAAVVPASATSILSTTCASLSEIGGTWYRAKCTSTWPWENFHYQAWASCSISGPGEGEFPIYGAIGESYRNKIWSTVDCWPAARIRSGFNTW